MRQRGKVHSFDTRVDEMIVIRHSSISGRFQNCVDGQLRVFQELMKLQIREGHKGYLLKGFGFFDLLDFSIEFLHHLPVHKVVLYVGWKSALVENERVK